MVELCRGEKRNAMGLSFWRNYPKCFPRPVSVTLIDDQGAEAVEAVEAALMQGVRVVVVCAEGPSFTAGLDVTDAAMMSVIGGGGGGEQQQDAARVAFRARQHVLGMRIRQPNAPTPQDVNLQSHFLPFFSRGCGLYLRALARL